MTPPTHQSPWRLPGKDCAIVPPGPHPHHAVNCQLLGKRCVSSLPHLQPSQLCLQATCLERIIHLVCRFHDLLATENSAHFSLKHANSVLASFSFTKVKATGPLGHLIPDSRGGGSLGMFLSGTHCGPLVGFENVLVPVAFWSPVASPISPSSEPHPPHESSWPGGSQSPEPNLVALVHSPKHNPLLQTTSVQLVAHLGGTISVVLICSGCYNENTLSHVVYKQQTFIAHSSGG